MSVKLSRSALIMKNIKLMTTEDGSQPVVPTPVPDISKYTLTSEVDILPFTLSGVDFNPSGTKLVYSDLGGRIRYADLSTPFDVSSRGALEIEELGRTPLRTVVFAPDGFKMYSAQDGMPIYGILEYTLSTAYDVSTATFVSNYMLGETTTPFSIRFSNDGLKLFVLGFNQDRIFQYSLSSPYDLSTRSYDSVFIQTGLQDAVVNDFDFNKEGSTLYAVGSNTDSILQYDLSTNFDLSTASFIQSKDISAATTYPYAIRIVDNDQKIIVFGTDNSTVKSFVYTI